MNRAVNTLPGPSILALCIASACLLPACSGGGGVHVDSVAAGPPPPPAAPPPPPAPPAGPRNLELPPAPPIKTPPAVPAYNAPATNVVLTVPADDRGSALANVFSAGSLTKQGDGATFLYGNVRFDGGTFIQGGTLNIFFVNLFSDVEVAPGATLEMAGDVIGDLVNNGTVFATEPGGGWYENFHDGDVFGDYTQGPSGILRLLFGIEGTEVATPLLTVSGRASLDGTVQFMSSGFIPSAGYLEWILHAHGGISGQFDGWGTTGSPLFLTGDLRYTGNDVYFMATRVSTQATMAAANAGDALTRASAGRVDAAFRVADALALLPPGSLSTTQRQFLHSAAAIQNLRDYAQATTTFDSLSGFGHVDTVHTLLDQELATDAVADAHLAGFRRGAPVGRWSASSSLAGWQVQGLDQWLGDSLLFGMRLGWSLDDLRFQRSGGFARGRSPAWGLSLRSLGKDGSYLLGNLGYSRHELDVDRPIDLGGVRRLAQSRPTFDALHASVEAGRLMQLPGGELVPFASLAYAAVGSSAFAELGSTGFELEVQSSRFQRVAADVGLRYGNSWRWDSDRWLQLSLEGRHRQALASDGRLRASFAGAPEATFDLTGLPGSRGENIFGAQLLGGGQQWSWRLAYDRRRDDSALSVGLSRDFH